MCACRPSVIAFYEVVLDEFVRMYKEAGIPLHTFHSGGDEVPADAWKGSPMCKKYMSENPGIMNTRNLQADLFSRLLPLFEKRNIEVGGWEEIVMFYNQENKSCGVYDIRPKVCQNYFCKHLKDIFGPELKLLNLK